MGYVILSFPIYLHKTFNCYAGLLVSSIHAVSIMNLMSLARQTCSKLCSAFCLRELLLPIFSQESGAWKWFWKRIAAEPAPCNISKTALNMLTVHQSKQLEGKVIVVCVDPGHLKTVMGGRKAVLEVEGSAKGLLTLLAVLKFEDNGRLLLYNEVELPRWVSPWSWYADNGFLKR